MEINDVPSLENCPTHIPKVIALLLESFKIARVPHRRAIVPERCTAREQNYRNDEVLPTATILSCAECSE
jgi:hypothetical protein